LTRDVSIDVKGGKALQEFKFFGSGRVAVITSQTTN